MKPDKQKAPPWLDLIGGNATEETIRDASKGWSPKQWESYLLSTETGLKESQPSLVEVERLGLASSIFELCPRTCSQKDLLKWIRKLISGLNKKQKFVIKNIFWEGRSEQQIAEMMMVSRQAVYDFKKRALRKLIKNAKKALATFPIVEAQSEIEQHKPATVRKSRRKGEASC